jgi:hypothetical protein
MKRVTSAQAFLCWGILFFLQGRGNEAKEKLKVVKDKGQIRGIFKRIATKLIDCINVTQRRNIEEDQRRELQRKYLLDLLEPLDVILNPPQRRGPRLAKECDRINRNEGRESGYSRDPFKRISLNNKADIVLAAIVYLLRGYATFFCRPRSLRDFNAAKVSVNDFFQCGQLTWRLYNSLRARHSQQGTQKEYLDEVAQGDQCKGNSVPPPEISAYFVWNTMSMLELQRGNVYRQIDYLDEASRFYLRFHRRFEHLARETKCVYFRDPEEIFGDKWKQMIFPRMITALFEMSKVQFDLGYFLESLINRNLSLMHLVKLDQTKTRRRKNENPRQVIDDILKVVEFLNCERRQSAFDKELIAVCYGYPKTPQKPFGMTNPITPKRFKNQIADEHLQLSADILARIGFVLYTLRRVYLPIRKRGKVGRTKVDDRQREINNWLKPFFEAHRYLSSVIDDEKSSRFGQYWLRLVGAQPKKDIGWDSVEEQFAYCLPYDRNQEVLKKIDLGEREFYRAILAATTENIVNLATIPKRNQGLLMRRGYRYRRQKGDLSRKSVHEGVKELIKPGTEDENQEGPKGSRVQNKLVVLRRWQSVNPKFPRPGQHKLRGGGYFLLWQGRGIVIDPGYDFIQNFYDEGFSLEDIDAVIVTHSHPDHDDDLSTLTTLIREWNEHHKLTGRCDEEHGTKRLDFFLNESTNLKFSAWLKSSEVQVGRIIPLPSLWWDKDSGKPTEGKIRGKPVMLDLRNVKNWKQGYSLQLEVMPAWHDDVIGKTEAIGLKFHLYEPREVSEDKCNFNPAGKVGYTGDTGVFGHYMVDSMRAEKRENFERIGHLYTDCDILIAHLGDIKMRELLTKIRNQAVQEPPIQKLLRAWFYYDEVHPERIDDNRYITPGRVRDFIHFLIALDLVPREALLMELELCSSMSLPLCEWLKVLCDLSHFNDNSPINLRAKNLISELDEAANTVFEDLGFDVTNRYRGSAQQQIIRRVNDATVGLKNRTISDKRAAWALLGFLCGFAMVPWQYPYHLGIFGIYELFRAMVEECRKSGKKKRRGRLFIVGELPEELSSYRHQVTLRLNATEGNLLRSGVGEIQRRVHAFTGDIGLHVGISKHEEGHLLPRIRCAFCNYNNETVLKAVRDGSEVQENYHSPSEILEVAIKRHNCAMIYLCTKHDHYPDGLDFPRHFLSHPILRVV